MISNNNVNKKKKGKKRKDSKAGWTSENGSFMDFQRLWNL